MIELRDLVESDIPAIAAFANNYSVSRYMASRMPYPYTIEDARWWVTTGSKEQGLNLAVSLDGTCIGVVGVRPGENEYRYSAEIGYWIAEQYWGKGFGSQVVAEMTSRVFAETEIVRLYAPVYSPNKASMRILEKNGYTLEAIHRRAVYKDDSFLDEHVFVIFRPCAD